MTAPRLRSGSAAAKIAQAGAPPILFTEVEPPKVNTTRENVKRAVHALIDDDSSEATALKDRILMDDSWHQNPKFVQNFRSYALSRISPPEPEKESKPSRPPAKKVKLMPLEQLADEERKRVLRVRIKQRYRDLFGSDSSDED